MKLNTLNPLFFGPTDVESGGGVFTVIDRQKRVLGCSAHYNTNDRICKRVMNLFRALLSSKTSRLILVHDLWTFEALVLSFWPTVVIFPHGMLEKYALAGRWYKKLFLFMLYSKTRFAALTEKEENQIKFNKRLSVVHRLINTVDLPDMSKSIRADYVYVGRITSKKNVLVMISAFKDIPNCKLDIYGFFTDSEIEGEVTSALVNTPNINYNGAYEPDMVTGILGKYKYLVLTSLSEGLPMVCLEGLASGCGLIISEHCNLNPAIFDNVNVIESGTTVRTIQDAIRHSSTQTPDPLECRTLLEKYYGLAVFETSIKSLLSYTNL